MIQNPPVRALATTPAAGRPDDPAWAPAPEQRLKIAYVHDGLYPYFKGGAERRFYETARLLAERHDVTYITWQYWDGPPTVEQDGIHLRGVGRPQAFYGDDGKRTISEALAFAGRLVPLFAKERFDVVDCCATPLLAVYLTWLTARWQREPLVVTWHEFWGDYWLRYLEHRPLVARVAKAIEAGSVGRSNAIVAVSRFTAAKLRAQAPGARIQVVENGVSLPDIDAAPPRPDAPDVLFAGRLIDDKRVDVLLEALARVSTTLPNVTAAVVGEGPERAKLEALARSLGLAERVQFRGFVEESELYGLMKGASVFVLPSVREGFGLAVIEAQACGAVPVVVRAPYNAAVDLISDGEDGVVCAPDASSLADTIGSLLQEPGRRMRLAANGRRAAQRRDWSNVAARLEALYRELAIPSTRRAA